ncbi:MAG: NAD(P)-dependent dehydrogenase (short-subunit alcohol dehydrogenase family) [Cyclobacteriaceae bacterium]|jgi:NAD(P)-dependent dehydrogenase (short-subunit alcohol dehydrogenase family)
MGNYFIVGGSSGIGNSIVQKLANSGNDVFSTFDKTNMESESDNIVYHHLDVTASETDLSYLPEVIDGFAYCPGSINLLPFARIKPADFVKDFELQVIGAIKILQQILPRLKKSQLSSVLFFSTVAVQTGFNFHSQVAASKGAIEGLTRSLAAELAPNVRVNAIAPSIIDTPLAKRFLNTEEKKKANADRHPLKTIGSTEDIAAMASFLLGNEARWITGQIITIDGGISTLKV